jgi:glutaredoxin
LLRYNAADWERMQRAVWKILGRSIVLLERRHFHLKRCFAVSVRMQIMNGSPEDKRLAASGPRAITLYTRPGCHLCEEAKALIESLLSEFGATLREVNIDEDEVLRQRYGTDIPVIFIGSRKAAKHRVDPVKFRRQLSNAV